MGLEDHLTDSSTVSPNDVHLRVRILETIAQKRAAYTAEIARELDLERGRVDSVLRDLEREGWIKRPRITIEGGDPRVPSRAQELVKKGIVGREEGIDGARRMSWWVLPSFKLNTPDDTRVRLIVRDKHGNRRTPRGRILDDDSITDKYDIVDMSDAVR